MILQFGVVVELLLQGELLEKLRPCASGADTESDLLDSLVYIVMVTLSEN